MGIKNWLCVNSIMSMYHLPLSQVLSSESGYKGPWSNQPRRSMHYNFLLWAHQIANLLKNQYQLVPLWCWNPNIMVDLVGNVKCWWVCVLVQGQTWNNMSNMPNFRAKIILPKHANFCACTMLLATKGSPKANKK